MAFELPLFMVPGCTANADLSTKQFYCVKPATTAPQVQVCTVDGEVFLGVLQNKPAAAGRSAEVMGIGVTKVVASEAMTYGSTWGTASDGRGKVVEASITGADVGDYAAGIVLGAAAAAGDLASVTVGFPTFRVELQ